MLGNELERLEHADLIRRAQTIIEIEYWFKHGLVQESTYESLLKQDRKRLHRFVAEAMERAPEFSADAVAALLARHWDDADESARAFGYYVRAGDAAARRYTNAEALMSYQRALELAATLDVSNDALLHLYEQRGRVFELNAQYDEAIANYEELQIRARLRGDRTSELAALMAQIPVYATPSARFNFEHGAELTRQAISLASVLNDRAAQAKALWLRMLLHVRNNRWQMGASDGETALTLARSLGLKELTAYILNDLSGVYVKNGDFERVRTVLQEANVLWRELNNLPMLADNLSSAANYLIYSGDLGTVFRRSQEAYDITEQIGNLWGQSYSLMMVGLAHVERGDFALGLAKMRECIALGDRAGFLAPHLDTQLDLARTHIWLGAPQRALKIAQDALKELERFPIGIPLCYATLTECHTAAGELDRAADSLHRARETYAEGSEMPAYKMHIERAALILAESRGEWEVVRALTQRFISEMAKYHVRLYLADAWLYRARSLAQLGDMTVAFDALSQGDAVARELGSRRVRWQILALGATLEHERGNTDAAHALRQEARGIIRYIIEHAPEDLCNVFSGRADVRAVMEDD